jgi:YHS domain-containing protein
MHTGTALRRGEDWFGATVNLSARVSGAAAGGEVLLTAATREAAGEVDGIEVVEHGRHELRNTAEPVELFRALPVSGERTANRLPIDPVCRMAVDPDDAAGALRHEGERFYFCSMKCAKAFADNPARYAQAGAAPERGGG